jgi:MFS family permease
MAMFVLVVDASLMNVSISAVVRYLDTTVSGVQSAIALEALVSAAFILIGSKVGDLFGRKRAYVLDLLGYAVGALAMAFARGLTAIIIFWAIVGGLGASLLLPAMQSLIHGNFEGAAQKKAYVLVGAAAAIAAAVGPLVGGFITTYLSWRIAFLLEVVIIAIVLSGIRLVRDAPYTDPRGVDTVGALLSVPGMGGIVLGILVWQEGGESVAALLAIGAIALAALVYWLVRRKRQGKPTLLDPDLFKSKIFKFGISEQMLQQIALGGTVIALPIYLQMVLEYNAMQAKGLGLCRAAPLLQLCQSASRDSSHTSVDVNISLPDIPLQVMAGRPDTAGLMSRPAAVATLPIADVGQITNSAGRHGQRARHGAGPRRRSDRST